MNHWLGGQGVPKTRTAPGSGGPRHYGWGDLRRSSPSDERHLHAPQWWRWQRPQLAYGLVPATACRLRFALPPVSKR